jgi:hypothetical protein
MYGFNHRKTRPETCKLIDMMDEGVIDARAVADMALSWLSEDDVKRMMQANDIPTTGQDEDDENIEIDLDGGVSAVNEQEEWTPDNADYCDPGSRHHY